jgi:hypothetical protein
MGWPGWTGYGWAKDDEDDAETAKEEAPPSSAERTEPSQVKEETNPTSLKALLGRLGYNLDQLKFLMDYVEEEDSFRIL